ncbi:hypothetical protein CEXT_632891 [Caerostris extrusa]|uniref:Uncharacterized protein n=1 Tax=Caerostris extrusa TaxID=172846 RepID=A0AAV4VUP9_CAEEX|nr:hypothetical protein CEXT_632891 [Caerostris extrusa]
MGVGKRCLRIHFVRGCYRKLKCALHFVCSNVTPTPTPSLSYLSQTLNIFGNMLNPVITAGGMCAIGGGDLVR